jgi:F420-dependent oxidoreductase-like protein
MSIHSKPGFGVQVPQQNARWDELRRVWSACEESRFESLWVFDHLMPIFSDPGGPCFEAWSTLGWLAAATRRIRIGCMVTANTLRSPALLAKMAVTIDHASGGRLDVGIGAAWFEAEHAAYGFPFRTPRERVERLAESVSILRALWTEPRVAFRGKFYGIIDAPFEPKPLQKPHPPIWIGGRGPKWTLPVVARFANGWNVTPFFPPDELAALNRRLDECCREIGRPPEDIRRSLLVPFCISSSSSECEAAVERFSASLGMPAERGREIMLWGDAERIADRIGRYCEAGESDFVLMMSPPFEERQLHRFSEEVVAKLQ